MTPELAAALRVIAEYRDVQARIKAANDRTTAEVVELAARGRALQERLNSLGKQRRDAQRQLDEALAVAEPYLAGLAGES